MSLEKFHPEGDSSGSPTVSNGVCNEVDNIGPEVSQGNIERKPLQHRLNLNAMGVSMGAEQPCPFVTSTPSKPSKPLQGKTSKHFAGVESKEEKTSFDNLLCIEIFSGSGRLTAAIRKMGLRAVAIDRSATRMSGPVTLLDLI